MRHINLLYLILMLFAYYCLLCSVACTMIVTEMSLTDHIDLGFNNAIEDSCDYCDYSSDETGSKFNGLAVLQYNIQGVLGKQDSLKLLLNDIKRDCRVQVIMLVETWLKNNNANRVKYLAIVSLVPTGKAKWEEELES